MTNSSETLIEETTEKKTSNPLNMLYFAMPVVALFALFAVAVWIFASDPSAAGDIMLPDGCLITEDCHVMNNQRNTLAG